MSETNPTPPQHKLSLPQRAFAALPQAINTPLYLQILKYSSRDTVSMDTRPQTNQPESTTTGPYWSVTNERTGERFLFPTKPVLGQVGKVSNGYSKRMVEKYAPPDMISLDADSTVIDVGAFVGAFSRALAPTTGRVLAVEPAPKTADCLRHNLAGFDTVSIYEGAIGETDGFTDLNLGANPADNSRLNIDGEPYGFTTTAEMRRLDTLCDDYGIDTVDLLKIDAEGAEPEVLDGLGGVSIRQVSVDVTPERYGESTAGEVDAKLRDRGFETQLVGDVVIGFRDGD